LLFTKDIIVFFLFAEEIQVFTGELQYISASLNLIINELVSWSLGFAGAVPEMYFNSRDQRYNCVLKRIDCKGNWAQDFRRILSNIIDCGYDTTHL